MLLSSGYHFKDALMIMGISDKLNIKLKDEGIEMSVVKNSPKEIRGILNFFIHVSSLENAINSTLSIIDFKRKLRQTMAAKTAYPLFILVFAFVTIFIFSDYIIPQLLEGFESEDSFLYMIVLMMKTIAEIIFAFLLMVIVFCASYCISYRIKNISVLFLCKHFSIFTEYLSYNLASYLNELYKCGLI